MMLPDIRCNYFCLGEGGGEGVQRPINLDIDVCCF